MKFDKSAAKAILFDYGNTVVEFGAAQIHRCDRALADELERRCGPVDYAELRRIRDADRRAPYAGDPPAWRENDLPAITANAVRRLYGREPTPEELAALLRVRFESFVAAVEAPPWAEDVLSRLGAGRRLALVSNYPDGRAIRESLRRTGLGRFFEVVVVSGDLGVVKPHPRPFRVALGPLGLEPGEAVFVGDNRLADVQGARRLGMPAVLTTQWIPPEDLPGREDDLPPTATIRHFTELCALFGV